MPTYRVTATGTVTEYYLVEADSEEQAMRDWSDGTLVGSEADTNPVSAILEEA